MLPLFLLLLSPVADAVVRLQNSVLYDEEDFKGVDKVTTDMCAAGCKIYATVFSSPENSIITANIFVNDPNTKEDLSIAELSFRKFINSGNAKGYLEIGNAPAVTISNKNANKESGPFALWIVSTKSSYYKTADVFEPATMSREKSIPTGPITILSAYAFTVAVKPGDNTAVLARTTGYDAIDRNGVDNCFQAMDNDFDVKFDGVTFKINGPLLTLKFNTDKFPNSKVDVAATNTFDFSIVPTPTQPTFISSPGFVCGSSTSPKVYRSSALRKSDAYSVKSANGKDLELHFEIDIIADGAHPVVILDNKSGTDLGFYGNFKDKTNLVPASFTSNSATVSFTPGPDDSFFGMRIWADDVNYDTKTTTTTTKKNDVTTSVSTTTSAFESTTSLSGAHQFMLLVLTVLLVV